MPKASDFQKLACNNCSNLFTPSLLTEVNKMLYCPECLKLTEPKEAGANIPIENNTQLENASANNIANQEHKLTENIEEIIGREINLKSIGIILLRIVFYVGGALCLDPEGYAYAIIDGIMLADLVTWLLFSIIQLPFRNKKFLTEFCIYGLMISFLGATGKLVFNFQSGGVMPAFMIAGVLKALYWVQHDMLPDDDLKI